MRILLVLGMVLVAVPGVFAGESVNTKARDAGAFVCGKRFVTFRTGETRVTVLKAHVVILRGPTKELRARKEFVGDLFIKSVWHNFGAELKKDDPEITINGLAQFIRQQEREDPAVVKEMADDLYEKYRGRALDDGTRITRRSYDRDMGLTDLMNLTGEVGAQITPKRWRSWDITYETHVLLVRCLN